MTALLLLHAGIIQSAPMATPAPSGLMDLGVQGSNNVWALSHTLDIGAPAPDRIVFVLLGMTNFADSDGDARFGVPNLSINGAAMTLVNAGYGLDFEDETELLGIWHSPAFVTAGTQATIGIGLTTFSGAPAPEIDSSAQMLIATNTVTGADISNISGFGDDNVEAVIPANGRAIAFSGALLDDPSSPNFQ